MNRTNGELGLVASKKVPEARRSSRLSQVAWSRPSMVWSGRLARQSASARAFEWSMLVTVGKELGPSKMVWMPPHGPVRRCRIEPSKGSNGSIALRAYLYPHGRPFGEDESPRNCYMS
jgi:hypothetical protein